MAGGAQHDDKRPLGPEDLTGASFRTALRGFDQLEVKALLNRAADRIRALSSELERISARLADAEQRAVDLGEMDDAAVAAVLGEETARVLQSARQAAADIRTSAEAKSAATLKAAEAQAQALRDEARGLVDRERAKAEAEAAQILEQAKAAGRRELEQTRDDCKRMIVESKALRSQVLGDLAARRKLAHRQIEQLQAARKQLLETFGSVQRTVSEATRDLDAAEEAAVLAAEEAAERSIHAESEEADLELEHLVATAFEVEEPAEPVVPEAEAGAAGEGPAELPAEDAPAADEPDSDATRHSSALRILRPDGVEVTGPRPKPAPEPRRPPGGTDDVASPSGGEPDVAAAAPPGTGFGVLPPADEVEGVRLLPPVERAPGPAGTGEPSGAAGEDASAEATHGDEPPEEDPAADAHPQPASEVDALFARIRAGREEATRWAEGVLDQPGDEGDEPAAATPAGANGDGSDAAVAGDGSDAAGSTGEGEAPPPAARPAPFAARDDVVAAVAGDLVRRLRRVLADEQNDALAAVRSARAWPSLDDVVKSSATQVAAFAAAGAEPLAEAAAGGASAAGGSSPGPVGPLADAMGTAIVEPLRERVERVLIEAKADLSDGRRIDDQELADRVSAVYREWRRQRLDEIAAAWVAAAFARGAFDALGDEQPVVWVCDPQSGPCSPDCEDNALAGPVARGDTFPAGLTHPPAFPGCRCLVLGTGR